jgi:hypothetical protein
MVNQDGINRLRVVPGWIIPRGSLDDTGVAGTSNAKRPPTLKGGGLSVFLVAVVLVQAGGDEKESREESP